MLKNQHFARRFRLAAKPGQPILGNLVKATRLGFHKVAFGHNLYMRLDAFREGDEVIEIVTCPLQLIDQCVQDKGSRTHESKGYMEWWEGDGVKLIPSAVFRYIRSQPNLAGVYATQFLRFGIPASFDLEERPEVQAEQ